MILSLPLVRMNCKCRPYPWKLAPCNVLILSRIVVYPPSGAGALNIMKSDLKRLDDMCYLNDTLIEFGLKYGHCHLGPSRPLTSSKQTLAR